MLVRRCNGKKGKLGIRVVGTLQSGCGRDTRGDFFHAHVHAIPDIFRCSFTLLKRLHIASFSFIRVYESISQKFFCSELSPSIHPLFFPSFLLPSTSEDSQRLTETAY